VAWKEYEAIDTPMSPNPLVFPPRGTVLHAFELRYVYKPHRPSPVARLELVSAQYGLCMIDPLKDPLLAFFMGDRFARLKMSGKPHLRTTLSNYTPTVDRQFYKWGLDCCMVELSNLTYLSYLRPIKWL
jgi:hypothetical protein